MNSVTTVPVPSEDTSRCFLCYDHFLITDSPINLNSAHNLYKLCCKYLHSAITKENPLLHREIEKPVTNQPLLCPKCFESAVELTDLAEKLEFFQKSVSELVLIFSLGILNRRGRAKENVGADKAMEKKSMEVDISPFPDCDSWIFSTSATTFSIFCSASENIRNDNTTDIQCYPSPITEENVNDIAMNAIKIEVTENDWAGANFQSGTEVVDNEDITEKKVNIATNFLSAYHNISATNVSKAIGKVKKTKTHKFQKPRVQLSIPKSNVVIKDAKIEASITNEQDEPTFSNALSKILAAGHLQKRPHTPNRLKDLMKSKAVDNLASTSSSATENSKSATEKHVKRDRFVCDICGKEYLKKQDYVFHKTLHTGEGSYQCSLCDRSFLTRSHFKRHKNEDHGEKLEKCEMCGKEFLFKSILNRHLKSHTGEKPFKCDECDYSTPLSFKLTTHKMNKHSDKRRFKCIDCGKTFKTKTHVKTHYKQVHFALDFSDDCAVVLE